MRCVPGLGKDRVREAAAIDVANHGAAERRARPIVARQIEVARKYAALGRRAGHDVVIIRRVADTGDDGAALGQRCLHAELVVVAVQIVDVLRDDLALEVLPGAVSDPVAGVDWAALRTRIGAQVRAPSLAAGAGRRRQRLAMAIRALQAAKIPALAGACAGDEKDRKSAW